MRSTNHADGPFEALERSARYTRGIRPLSKALRREWEAALKTGNAGRRRKDPRLKSRIVPISIDPKLLKQVDKFAKAAGLTRSSLVSEGLRLRMKS